MKKSLMCLALALVAALAVPSFAAVTTSAAGNPINASYAVPYPASGRSCASVQVSTIAPTLVLAARTGRISLEVVNVSSVTLGADTPRPALVYMSTGATTNLGSNPTRSSLNTMNAIELAPLTYGSNLSSLMNSNWTRNGGGTYSGAIYAQAESSSTITFNPLGQVQACEEY